METFWWPLSYLASTGNCGCPSQPAPKAVTEHLPDINIYCASGDRSDPSTNKTDTLRIVKFVHKAVSGRWKRAKAAGVGGT